MKNNKRVPKLQVNPKRVVAKALRGKGLGAMNKLGATPVEWCQSLDPLFKVKGKERHARLKQVR
jgi:hypothetical protein